MDDLAGLDWSASAPQSNRPTPLNNTANYYPNLKPTPPLSGRSTPTVSNLPKPPSTPANTTTPVVDSFANLLPTINSAQAPKNLSLKEQQALLEEQKRQKALQSARQWDTLGTGSTSTSASVSRTASPAPFSVQALNGQSSGQRLPIRSATPLQQSSSNAIPARKQSEDINDILAAFDSSAPVDKSTNFPVPSRSESRNVGQPAGKSTRVEATELFGDDDDPFGLGTIQNSKSTGKSTTATNDNDDDVLGLLGKPVSELPPPARSTSSNPTVAAHPVDAAVAELVDMGFDAEKAKDALATTESGLDVQAAVGYLLNQAHSASRNKNRSEASPANGTRRRPVDEASEDAAWARPQKSGSRRRDEENGTVSTKEPAKIAADIGNNLFKTANSLWRAGQKKVNKALAEYNTGEDSSQPKWMRDATQSRNPATTDSVPKHSTSRSSSRNDRVQPAQTTITDEAALLEMGSGRPQPTKTKKSGQPPMRSPDVELNGFREESSNRHRMEETSTHGQRPFVERIDSRPPARTKLTREMNEETSAYVSPARRKKATTQPVTPQPESNLLFDDTSASTTKSTRPSQNAASGISSSLKPVPVPATTSKPAPPKAKPAPRNIPALSASILQSSTSNRVKGTAAFKLGNYADAHALYTAALRDIPSQHPLNIVLLTNRALTGLKTGDPKQCIADADTAIEIIGISRGVNESIAIGGDEGTKDMAPYWGKAMMRRAEAMEQLERWADAAQAWKSCVEAGVGGAQSIQGRARCEKASGAGQSSQPPSRKPTPAAKKPTLKPPTRTALDDLAGRPAANTAASSEAVTRLRAANDAAAKLDDERFALSDAVADRIQNWKKGKEQNLRALLQSLDTVLWADSGWKKVGMAELLNPNKVKINYMKGIAKVHPDKLPPSATTEQIMISGAVFSTLNEAWDGFKKENGL